MKYVAEMGSDIVIYTQNFIKISSDIQECDKGASKTCRQPGDGISLLLFFQNQESRLITRDVIIANNFLI
jgi:hypothetical protein